MQRAQEPFWQVFPWRGLNCISIFALSEDGPSSHPVSQPSRSLAVESTLLALETTALASRYTPPPPPGVGFDVQIALQIPLLQHPTLILVIARCPAVNQIILPAFWYLETKPRSDKAMSCTGKTSQYWTPLHSLANTWCFVLYSLTLAGIGSASMLDWKMGVRPPNGLPMLRTMRVSRPTMNTTRYGLF
jgi:hypothetical protein